MNKGKICVFFLVLFFLLVFNDDLNAQNKVYQGLIGGMFLHQGYFEYKPDFLVNQQITGRFSGIGGKIAFNFTPFFRVGSEGYSSKCVYSENKSFFEIGWGGILLETGYLFNKIRPFACTTIGGGGITQLHIGNMSQNKIVADYYTYSLFVYSLFTGMEFHLTKKFFLP